MNCGNFNTVTGKCGGKRRPSRPQPRSTTHRGGATFAVAPFSISGLSPRSTCFFSRPLAVLLSALASLLHWPARPWRPTSPALVEQPHHRRLQRARDGDRRAGGLGRARAAPDPRGPGGRPALCPHVRQARGHRQARRQQARADRGDHRQAGRQRSRGRARARAGQQPPARHDRGRGRLAHPDEPRSRACGCDAADALFKRRDADGAGGPRRGARRREGPAHQARDERGARRHRAATADAPPAQKLEAIAAGARARRPRALGVLQSPSAAASDAEVKAAADGRRRDRSTRRWPPGRRRRTSGTASRWARCCCWPPSASPSPSASWA